MTKMTFLGLGVMGYPMAGHLAAGHLVAGHLAEKASIEIAVYNRNFEKAQKWQAQNPQHKAYATIAEAVKESDFVMMCVGDDPDVEAVALGADGALENMKEGAILIDHTTASAKLARRLYEEAKKRNIDFLDAPVSGGQAGAEKGVLTIMVGGDEAAYAKAGPVLDCYARSHALIGPTGSGQLAKMVNQICIVGLVQGLSEGVKFGKNAGLDMEKVIEVISQGAAGSWQMENRSHTMIKDEFDFGFAIDWVRKDLRICLDEARGNGSDLPIAAIVDQFYARLQKQGKGRQDTSSLIQLLS